MRAEQNTIDDEVLIAAARSGDERAFAQLVERYKAAQSGYVTMLNRSAHILQLWTEREGLQRTD